MRQQPQLDLRVIRAQQHRVLASRDERLADHLSLVGAHRDVLQVRVARAQPSRRRHRLVERRVDASRARRHQFRQRIDVRPLQLRQEPVFEHQLRQVVHHRQHFEHALVCGIPGLGAFLPGQSQLFKEHHAQLLRRVDVELLAGRRVDRRLQFPDPLPHPPAQAVQDRNVHRDPGPLHVAKHVDERDFEVAVEPVQFRLHQFRPQEVCNLPGEVGVRAGIIRHLLRRRLAHQPLFFPLPDKVGDGGHLASQELGRKVVQRVPALPRV